VDPDMTVEDVLTRMPEILAEPATAWPRTTGETLALFMRVMGHSPTEEITSVGGASDVT
jgi:hypothetical protein